MITKFGCKNIKAIQDFDEIDIYPITIIMGENSSGKSSLLQALSFLSVNIIYGNSINRIKYNNPFSQFGNSNSFKNSGDEVVLSFEIDSKQQIKLIYQDENLEYGFLSKIESNPPIEKDEALNILEKELEVIRHIGKLKDKKETYDYTLDYIGYFGENFKQRVTSLKNTRFIKNTMKEIFNYDFVIDKRKQELFINIDNKKLELSMFGTSISSTIPILTQFALNRQTEIKDKYRLTIIEEPELNLHPKSQAKFIEVILNNIPKKHSTIIETHSDHIINKLASLISSKKVKYKDVVIYYKIKNSKFQKIEFNKCGQFVGNFPTGFFDATLDDIYNLKLDC